MPFVKLTKKDIAKRYEDYGIRDPIISRQPKLRSSRTQTAKNVGGAKNDIGDLENINAVL